MSTASLHWCQRLLTHILGSPANPEGKQAIITDGKTEVQRGSVPSFRTPSWARLKPEGNQGLRLRPLCRHSNKRIGHHCDLLRARYCLQQSFTHPRLPRSPKTLDRDEGAYVHQGINEARSEKARKIRTKVDRAQVKGSESKTLTSTGQAPVGRGHRGRPGSAVGFTVSQAGWAQERYKADWVSGRCQGQPGLTSRWAKRLLRAHSRRGGGYLDLSG